MVAICGYVNRIPDPKAVWMRYTISKPALMVKGKDGKKRQHVFPRKH